jgi:hypothetical protein
MRSVASKISTVVWNRSGQPAGYHTKEAQRVCLRGEAVLRVGRGTRQPIHDPQSLAHAEAREHMPAEAANANVSGEIQRRADDAGNSENLCLMSESKRSSVSDGGGSKTYLRDVMIHA